MTLSNRVNLIKKFGSFLAIAGLSSVVVLPAVAQVRPGTQPSAQANPTNPTRTPSSTAPVQPASGMSSGSISCAAANGSSTMQGTPGNVLPALPGTKGSATKPAKGSQMEAPAQPQSGSMEAPSSPQPSSAETLNQPASAPLAAPSSAKKDNLISRAESKGSFKILMAAVKAAGLTETLACQGPYTVFAPTDAAFAALPKGTLEALLKPENKAALVKILTYHVVSGEVLSKALKAGSVATVEGASLTVKLNGKQVMIDNAKVVQPDVVASNGVIHAIDKVIVPSSLR